MGLGRKHPVRFRDFKEVKPGLIWLETSRPFFIAFTEGVLGYKDTDTEHAVPESLTDPIADLSSVRHAMGQRRQEVS